MAEPTPLEALIKAAKTWRHARQRHRADWRSKLHKQNYDDAKVALEKAVASYEQTQEARSA